MQLPHHILHIFDYEHFTDEDAFSAKVSLYV